MVLIINSFTAADYLECELAHSVTFIMSQRMQLILIMISSDILILIWLYDYYGSSLKARS